jgi:hypothetical protein
MQIFEIDCKLSVRPRGTDVRHGISAPVFEYQTKLHRIAAGTGSNRTPLTMRRLLLVYPGKQTSSEPVGIRKSSHT